MKIAYQAGSYDEYIGPPVECFPSPEEPGEFIIPGGCIEAEPLPHGEGQINVLNPARNGWQLVADLRGTEYYLPNGARHVMEVPGDLPDGATLDAPPPPPPTLAQLGAMQAARMMTANTQISILTDAVDPDIVDSPSASDAALLVEWKKYRQALRLVNLDAPVWPVEPAKA